VNAALGLRRLLQNFKARSAASAVLHAALLRRRKLKYRAVFQFGGTASRRRCRAVAGVEHAAVEFDLPVEIDEPNLWNLFMKKLTHDRVVPTVSANPQNSQTR